MASGRAIVVQVQSRLNKSLQGDFLMLSNSSLSSPNNFAIAHKKMTLASVSPPNRRQNGHRPFGISFHFPARANLFEQI
jgi:hypothetical protein